MRLLYKVSFYSTDFVVIPLWYFSNNFSCQITFSNSNDIQKTNCVILKIILHKSFVVNFKSEKYGKRRGFTTNNGEHIQIYGK